MGDLFVKNYLKNFIASIFSWSASPNLIPQPQYDMATLSEAKSYIQYASTSILPLVSPYAKYYFLVFQGPHFSMDPLPYAKNYLQFPNSSVLPQVPPC